jgi:hypothetical protein
LTVSFVTGLTLVGSTVAAQTPAPFTDLTPEALDGPAVDPVDIDQRITAILSDARYAAERETLLERLFGPLYDWVERMLAYLTDLVMRAFEEILSFLDWGTLQWLGPTLVGIAALVGALILGRRRARDIERRATIERILELGTDPQELERMAAAAHDRGDHAEAIRLRFVAGLLRLDAAGRIEFYPGLSNALVSAELADDTFDRLADQFDRVVYGRRPATADDSAAAEADWRQLLGVRA